MIDTHEWFRYGQAVRGRVRESVRRGRTRPACPRCLSGRAVGIVRIEIEELPGLPLTEQRDWQCRTCRSVVRETITGLKAPRLPAHPTTRSLSIDSR